MFLKSNVGPSYCSINVTGLAGTCKFVNTISGNMEGALINLCLEYRTYCFIQDNQLGYRVSSGQCVNDITTSRGLRCCTNAHIQLYY